MPTWVLAIILSSLGGLCELAGVLLVGREILNDRKRAQSMLGRLGEFKPPERRYPAPLSAPGLDTGLNPLFTTARHVSDLSRDLQKVVGAAGNAMLRLRQGLDAELDTATKGILDGVAERDAELREHLEYVLVGGLKVRAVGAVLLLLGIALGTAGSILGNVP